MQVELDHLLGLAEIQCVLENCNEWPKWEFVLAEILFFISGLNFLKIQIPGRNCIRNVNFFSNAYIFDIPTC